MSFLADKARGRADAVWDEKGYTDEKLQQIPFVRYSLLRFLTGLVNDALTAL